MINKIIILLVSVFPLLVSAQPLNQSSTFKDVIRLIVNDILNPLIVVIIGIAFLVFIWGLTKYISKSDNEAEQQKARSIMIYGILALFVMVSAWGLVRILTNTFFGASGPALKPPVPTVTY